MPNSSTKATDLNNGGETPQTKDAKQDYQEHRGEQGCGTGGQCILIISASWIIAFVILSSRWQWGLFSGMQFRQSLDIKSMSGVGKGMAAPAPFDHCGS